MVTALHPLRGEGEDGARTKVLRLGAVAYLNVAPIVHGLQGEPGFQLVRDVPSRVAPGACTRARSTSG